MLKRKNILKKFKTEVSKKIPDHVTLDAVDVWYQDEARFGQQNSTTRLWAVRGTRPRAVKQQQFEYAYIFGAVCPATGATEALILPSINMEGMREHLSLISQRTERGRHVVIIVDGAGFYQEYLADEFENITIIKLPPYSPELNPVEQVWQWLRQNELANQCFHGYEHIVNECSRAWNILISDVNRVKNICMRDWIKLTD